MICMFPKNQSSKTRVNQGYPTPQTDTDKYRGIFLKMEEPNTSTAGPAYVQGQTWSSLSLQMT